MGSWGPSEKRQNAPMYEEFLIVATTSNTCVGAGGKLRNPGGNPRFRGNPESPPRFPYYVVRLHGGRFWRFAIVPFCWISLVQRQKSQRMLFPRAGRAIGLISDVFVWVVRSACLSGRENDVFGSFGILGASASFQLRNLSTSQQKVASTQKNLYYFDTSLHIFTSTSPFAGINSSIIN